MNISLSTRRGDLLLRPSREGDAAAYRALRLEALERHPEAFGDDYASSAARPPQHWEERVRQGGPSERGVTYVAEAEGGLVGMMTLVRFQELKARHSGSIVAVYVSADWRGCGVGDALMEACLAHARRLDMRVVRLGVATTNASAIGLYLRQGFAVYGVERESMLVDGKIVDELLMVRFLKGEGSDPAAAERGV